MAVRLAEATLADGRVLLFEQDETVGAPPREVSTGDALGPLQIEAAFATIKAAAGQLGASLIDLPMPPDSYEITFGIKLNAAVGVILARAGTEANFAVKLSWSAKKS